MFLFAYFVNVLKNTTQLTFDLVRPSFEKLYQLWFFWIQPPSSCCCSIARSCFFATPWTAAHQALLSLTISWSFPKLMSIASVMPSSLLILWCPLLLLPSIFPSIRVFSNEWIVSIRWWKYWSFSSSSSNEYSGLVSLKIDWFDHSHTLCYDYICSLSLYWNILLYYLPFLYLSVFDSSDFTHKIKYAIYLLHATWI